MPTRVKITRPLGDHRPGDLVTLPDGQAASLIGAGLAQPTPLLEAPPRTGRGSGRQAWVDHATALGHTIPPDMPRADIITLVEG